MLESWIGTVIKSSFPELKMRMGGEDIINPLKREDYHVNYMITKKNEYIEKFCDKYKIGMRHLVAFQPYGQWCVLMAEKIRLKWRHRYELTSDRKAFIIPRSEYELYVNSKGRMYIMQTDYHSVRICIYTADPDIMNTSNYTTEESEEERESEEGEGEESGREESGREGEESGREGSGGESEGRRERGERGGGREERRERSERGGGLEIPITTRCIVEHWNEAEDTSILLPALAVRRCTINEEGLFQNHRLYGRYDEGGERKSKKYGFYVTIEIKGSPILWRAKF